MDTTQAPSSAPPSTVRASEMPTLSGEKVGRLLVTSLLGQGGMGVVYLAYDPELDRNLALKFIKPGRGSSVELDSRLRREGKALAKLQNPHIVGVYDIREFNNQTCIAMEYVQGQTVAEWLNGSHRPWREVVSVFIQAARGVAAAHAAGVLHRDLKPSNIMIGKDGRVRVMDFGIAQPRSVGELSSQDDTLASDRPDLDGEEVLTAPGQVLGTPAYMSPEQLLGFNGDKKSDQYSFCVTMWEALYGYNPSRDLTRGSAALKALSGARAVRRRGVRVPAWLRRVVERGMAARPEHRHESMDELLVMLQSNPTPRRWAIGAVCVGLLATGAVIEAKHIATKRAAAACWDTASVMAETWTAERRDQLRASITSTGLPFAAFTADRAIPMIDRYMQEIVESRARVCEASTIEGSMDPEMAALAYQCLDERRDESEALIEIYIDPKNPAEFMPLVEGMPLTLARLPSVARCEDESWLRARPRPPTADTVAPAEIAEVRRLLTMAATHARVKQYEPGMRVASEAHRRAEQISWGPLLAAAKLRLAVIHEIAGDIDPAIELLHSAFTIGVASHADEEAVEAATCLAHLFSRRKDDYVLGLHWVAMARMILERNNEPETGLLWSQVFGKEGTIYILTGKLDEGLGQLQKQLSIDERAVGADHPWIAFDLTNIGYAYAQAGKVKEAMTYWRRAEAIVEASFGPDHPQMAGILRNIAAGEMELGHHHAAEQAVARAIAIRERLHGPDHHEVAILLHVLAGVYITQGKYQDALEVSLRTLSIVQQDPGSDGVFLAHISGNLSLAYQGLGRYEEAIEASERSLDVLTKKLGDRHADVGSHLLNLGLAHLGKGDASEAFRTIEMAVTIQRESQGTEHPDYANTLGSLGMVHHHMGQHQKAIELLSESCTILAIQSPNSTTLASKLDDRATVYLELGSLDDARQSATAALRIFESVLGADHPRVAFPLTALGNCARAEGKLEEALESHRRALELREHGNVPSKYLAESLTGVGITELELGNEDAASFALTRVLALDQHVLDPTVLAVAQFGVARLLWQREPGSEQALELASQARQRLLEAQRGSANLESITKWLAERR
jgi:tetratricopeptide (TPR) repeat protein/predicted Ser/Thr protein kinase